MSGGFSFPLPPPPPPKAAPDWNTHGQVPQHGLRNGDGRGRGRGRGNSGGGRGRGRGNYAGNGRTNSGSFSGYSRESTTHGGSSSHQPHQQNYHRQTFQQNLPPGSYVNPDFGSQPLSLNHVSGYGQPSQTLLGAVALPSNSPPRTAAGHKRKLEALRGPREDRLKPAPPTAPAVPNFAALIVSPKNDQPLPQKPEARNSPTTNVLGLTPGLSDLQYSSSEDEDEKDVDEEALHAELGTTLTFEHNGTVMKLNSAADLAKWQQERKRNWPTTARMAEKELEKRRVGEERRRLLAGAIILGEQSTSQSLSGETRWQPSHGRNSGATKSFPGPDLSEKDDQSAKTTCGPESELEKTRREFAEQAAKLEALRKSVNQGAARVRGFQAEAVDTAKEASRVKASEQASHITQAKLPSDIEERGDVPQGDLCDSSSEVFSNSSVVSSDSELGSDEDEPPEEVTSKAPTTDTPSRPLCKFFVASGRCRDGDACRFRHELPARGSGAANATQQQALSWRKPAPAPKIPSVPGSEKKGIFQRLMEQEQQEEDRLALQVIKCLGKAGFFT